MTLFGQNQIRNFAVIKEDGFRVVSSAGYVTIAVNEPESFGSTATQEIGLEPIKVDCIRDIRVSKPNGLKTQTWTINMTNAVVTAGEAYGLTFTFRNWTGFDQPYVKHIYVYHKSGSNIYTEFEEAIKKAFEREVYKPFASVSVSGSSVVIVEKAPAYYPQWNTFDKNVELEIHVNDEDVTPWLAPTAISVSHTNGANGVIVAAMYDQFLRNRADRYGYVGYPDINLTGKNSVNVGGDYYFLDIKFYTQEHGMLNQNSEKEITLVCDDDSQFDTIIEKLMGVSDMPSAVETAGYTKVYKH